MEVEAEILPVDDGGGSRHVYHGGLLAYMSSNIAPNRKILGDRVYNQIRTLCSWDDAAAYFMDNLSYAKNLEATIIVLPDHHKVAFTDDLRARTKAALDKSFSYDKVAAQNAKTWFDDASKDVKFFTGYVHPEAAIMALAHHSLDPKARMPDYLSNLFFYEVCWIRPALFAPGRSHLPY